MIIITRFLYKIKQFYKTFEIEVGVSFIIIMVGLSSFYLGKHSSSSQILSKEMIEIESNSQEATTTQAKGVPKGAEKGQFMASKTGKRYYPLWCAAGQRIAEKNRVYFASAIEAEKTGLTKASNCKGF
jgi:micrococcal nuclease